MRCGMNPLSVSACSFAVVLAATQVLALQLEQPSKSAIYDQLEQLPIDDDFDGWLPGDTARPRMLVMRQCSGASAIMQFARHLLRFHGIPVPSAGMPPVSELIKLGTKYKFFNLSMGRALEAAQKSALAQNNTIFMHSRMQEIANDALWAEVKPSLQRMHVYTVLSSRINMLDQVICAVNDCSHDEYGELVDAATGETSHLCVNRTDEEDKSIDVQNEESQSEDKSTLIEHTAAHIDTYLFKQDEIKNFLEGEQVTMGNSKHFLSKGEHVPRLNASYIIEAIDFEYALVQETRARLEGAGFHFKEISEEDLMEFQANVPGALERAVNAWVDLLESFGADADKVIVRRYLRQFANTYPKAESHKTLIYNIEEIKKALNGSKYERFVRH